MGLRLRRRTGTNKEILASTATSGTLTATLLNSNLTLNRATGYLRSIYVARNGNFFDFAVNVSPTNTGTDTGVRLSPEMEAATRAVTLIQDRAGELVLSLPAWSSSGGRYSEGLVSDPATASRVNDWFDLAWPSRNRSSRIVSNCSILLGGLLGGEATRVGSTASGFGVDEFTPVGFDFNPSGTLYMLGQATGSLYTVNLTTGAVTRVAAYPSNSSKLAFNSSGTLYVLTDAESAAGTGTLRIVNPATGAVISTVGSVGVAGNFMIGMAFHPTTNVLYGSYSDNVGGFLYTIDVTTRATTRVGSTAGFGVGEVEPGALAFAKDGTLYMLGRTNDALYRVDTTTGAATRVGSAHAFGVNLLGPSCLAIHPTTGTAYMSGYGAYAPQALYTLDLGPTPAFTRGFAIGGTKVAGFAIGGIKPAGAAIGETRIF